MFDPIENLGLQLITPPINEARRPREPGKAKNLRANLEVRNPSELIKNVSSAKFRADTNSK